MEQADTPLLRSERTILRMGFDEDLPAIVEFVRTNRDFLAPFEPVRPEIYFTEEYWRHALRFNLQEFAQDRALRMFLFAAGEPRRVIGVVNFTVFVRGTFQACNLGYNLAEVEQGKGLMTEALREAIRFIFGPLNFHRIQANYLPHNERSGAVLRRLGFTVEGLARDYLRIDGKWQDHVLTSLVNPDWRPEPPLSSR